MESRSEFQEMSLKEMTSPLCRTHSARTWPRAQLGEGARSGRHANAKRQRRCQAVWGHGSIPVQVHPQHEHH